MRDYLKLFKGAASNSGPRAVPGLGDQTLWTPVNATNGMLQVARGSDLIAVQTYGKAPGAGTLEKSRPVMERVLAKLGT